MNTTERSGPSLDWMHEYVFESNKIDPQPGYENIPGSPRFDDHLVTLQWAVRSALCDIVANPNDCHNLLMHTFLSDAGKYRTSGVRVGPFVKPNPSRIAGMMSTWDRNVEMALCQGQSRVEIDPHDSVRQEIVWDLHYVYENIHPWVDGNGRSGRILMVNHAMLMGLDPWIVHHGDEQQAYYKRIEAHSSHAWGEDRRAW